MRFIAVALAFALASLGLPQSAVAAPDASQTAPAVQDQLMRIGDAVTLEGIINSSNYDPQVEGALLRLYRAFFDREPDVGGAQYWIDLNQNGWSLDNITEFFTQSQEFANNYAGTSDRVYLERVYRNVLGRDYDQGGFDYWLGFLESGELSRGGVVRWIAANREFINRYPYLPADIGGHTIAEALPLAGATFYHEEPYDDATWTGELAGLVEVPRSTYNDDQGRCLMLVGTMSPIRLEAGTHINSVFDTPNFGLIVEGERLRSSVNQCEEEGVEALGYEWRLDNRVTIGTDGPFYAEFFLPATGKQRIDAVFVGDPNQSSATFFAPHITDSIPEPPQSDVGANDFLKNASPFNEPFIHERAYSGVNWAGVLNALVESELRAGEVPGRCVHLLGAVLPLRIDDGIVTSGFDTPRFGLIVDGRLIDTGAGDCDNSKVENAGYDWILRAEVTVGTGYNFHDPFFIPANLTGEVQAIVVGQGYTANTLYYQVPPILTDVPSPR